MKLGDWRKKVGDDFSGDAEYMIRFPAPAGIDRDYTLELGVVKYSCEVYLNGRSVAASVFSPASVKLPRLQPENVLILRVSNTAANAFVHTDFRKWFSERTIGPYDEIEREYEKESLSSGLFGPVWIFW